MTICYLHQSSRCGQFQRKGAAYSHCQRQCWARNLRIRTSFVLVNYPTSQRIETLSYALPMLEGWTSQVHLAKAIDRNTGGVLLPCSALVRAPVVGWSANGSGTMFFQNYYFCDFLN